MRTHHVVTADGVPLVLRKFLPAKAGFKAAFVTHSQALHSLNVAPTMSGLAERGWLVHGMDLRGHGYSVSERAPYAHMEIGKGWQHLIEDLRLGLETAFDGVAWQDRLIVAPNIGALLVLELLKDSPDLARNIVFITPPPNQPALMKFARSVTRVRALVHPPERPDELTFHQLYTFLGAHLDDRDRLIDVISSDKAFTNAVLADPQAWPTPTTGYFYELFRGTESAWKWPDGATVNPATRLLVLYGGDDPMTANGRFVEPIRKHFERMGVTDFASHCVEEGRTALFAEEARFGISGLIDDWVAHRPLVSRAHPSSSGQDEIADVSREILGRLGFADLGEDLKPEELVELCYGAIDDESRWIEILYRFAYAASASEDLEETKLESLIESLMPHWDRSFNLNRQIMQSAAVGTVLQDVVERFNIGMAIVNDGFDISYANKMFWSIAKDLLPDQPAACATGDVASLSEALAPLIDADFRAKARSGNGEAILMHQGRAVGFHFRPRSLRQTSLNRAGASGVLILRAPLMDAVDLDDTICEMLKFGYGLTQKEAQATACLLNGLSPNDISDQLGVSVHTTRTHLKRVFDKVGVNGQTELAACLLQGPIGLLVGRS